MYRQEVGPPITGGSWNYRASKFLLETVSVAHPSNTSFVSVHARGIFRHTHTQVFRVWRSSNCGLHLSDLVTFRPCVNWIDVLVLLPCLKAAEFEFIRIVMLTWYVLCLMPFIIHEHLSWGVVFTYALIYQMTLLAGRSFSFNEWSNL